MAGHADRVELRSDLQAALATLKTRDRELLWLAYVEGCSHSEIAGIQGLRPASIRSMLHRAKRRLVAELETRGLSPQLNPSEMARSLPSSMGSPALVLLIRAGLLALIVMVNLEAGWARE